MNYLRQKSLSEFSNHGEATTAKSDLEQRIIISSRLRQRYGAASKEKRPVRVFQTGRFRNLLLGCV